MKSQPQIEQTVSDWLGHMIEVGEAKLNLPSEQEISALEHELGLGLPRAYKAFVKTLGAGMLMGYVVIASPGFNFLPYCKMAHDGLVIMRAVVGSLAPLKFYPEPGGLIPYATTIDSHWLCWDCQGDPDEWPTVVIDSGYSVNRFEGGFDSVLATLLNCPQSFGGFPEDMVPSRKFEPLGA